MHICVCVCVCSDEPTWKDVVSALSATCAGENPAAAEKLAKLCAESESRMPVR